MTRDEAIHAAGYIEGACLLLWNLPEGIMAAEAVAQLEEMAHGLYEYVSEERTKRVQYAGHEELAP